jgi:hypothetical protein
VSPAPTNSTLQDQIETLHKILQTQAQQMVDLAERITDQSAGGERRDKHLTEALTEIAEIRVVLKRIDEALFAVQPGQDRSFFDQAARLVADKVAIGRAAKLLMWVAAALAAFGISIKLGVAGK